MQQRKRKRALLDDSDEDDTIDVSAQAPLETPSQTLEEQNSKPAQRRLRRLNSPDSDVAPPTTSTTSKFEVILPSIPSSTSSSNLFDGFSSQSIFGTDEDFFTLPADLLNVELSESLAKALTEAPHSLTLPKKLWSDDEDAEESSSSSSSSDSEDGGEEAPLLPRKSVTAARNVPKPKTFSEPAVTITPAGSRQSELNKVLREPIEPLPPIQPPRPRVTAPVRRYDTDQPIAHAQRSSKFSLSATISQLTDTSPAPEAPKSLPLRPPSRPPATLRAASAVSDSTSTQSAQASSALDRSAILSSMSKRSQVQQMQGETVLDVELRLKQQQEALTPAAKPKRKRRTPEEIEADRQAKEERRAIREQKRAEKLEQKQLRESARRRPGTQSSSEPTAPQSQQPAPVFTIEEAMGMQNPDLWSDGIDYRVLQFFLPAWKSIISEAALITIQWLINSYCTCLRLPSLLEAQSTISNQSQFAQDEVNRSIQLYTELQQKASALNQREVNDLVRNLCLKFPKLNALLQPKPAQPSPPQPRSTELDDMLQDVANDATIQSQTLSEPAPAAASATNPSISTPASVSNAAIAKFVPRKRSDTADAIEANPAQTTSSMSAVVTVSATNEFKRKRPQFAATTTDGRHNRATLASTDHLLRRNGGGFYESTDHIVAIGPILLPPSIVLQWTAGFGEISLVQPKPAQQYVLIPPESYRYSSPPPLFFRSLLLHFVTRESASQIVEQFTGVTLCQRVLSCGRVNSSADSLTFDIRIDPSFEQLLEMRNFRNVALSSMLPTSPPVTLSPWLTKWGSEMSFDQQDSFEDDIRFFLCDFAHGDYFPEIETQQSIQLESRGFITYNVDNQMPAEFEPLTGVSSSASTFPFEEAFIKFFA